MCAAFSWPYMCLKSPRRPHITCLYSILAWGLCIWSDGLAAIGYTASTSLVSTYRNLKIDQCNSDTLRPAVVPYFRGLPSINSQQDNVRPHVSHHVLIFLDIQSIWLLPWPAWSPDLLPTENICSCIAERLFHHSFPANKVNEVWLDLDQHGISLTPDSSRVRLHA